MDLLMYMVGAFHILLFFNIVLDYIETPLPGEFLGFEKHQLDNELQILGTIDDENIY